MSTPTGWTTIDPVAQTVTTWTPDANGNPSDPVTRPFTAAEIAAAQRVATQTAIQTNKATWLQQLAVGVAQIQAARDAAATDQATADSLKAGADTLASQIGADIAAWQASTPAATVAYITALRDAVVKTAQREQQIVQAISALYAYRKAVDQNAVTTDDALLWLAKYVSADIA